MRSKPRLVFVALAAALTVGAIGVSTAGAAATKVTICVNKKNGIVHYAPSGKCAAKQTTIVVGRGLAGLRGAGGLRGAIGGTGAAGPAGGPQGVMGPQGVKGSQGGTGAPGSQGSDGIQGVAGPQGLQGIVGGTGPLGPIGGTGGPGVNAFHIVLSTANTLASGTATATCASGQVVTGGGFVISANVNVTSSLAHAGGTSWDVTYTSSAGAVSVSAQAVCAAGTETP